MIRQLFQDNPQLRQFVQSLPGLIYIIDREATIRYYDTHEWNRFAQENDAPELASETNVLGRNLFDFITGDEVRQSYRDFHEVLWRGAQEFIAISYRCDAPSFQREMYMEISPCRFGDGFNGLLYRSVLVRQHQRPAMNMLLRPEKKTLPIDPPIVTVCSYCLNIRDKNTNQWITPESYYQQGGNQQVALSHGICDHCMETKVKPALEAARAS